jgi:hypothetical protein
VRVYLVLVPGFDPVLFGRLAQDVAEAAASARDEDNGVRIFLSRINAWQVFLRKHEEGLSPEEQIGLFAELAFLRSIMKYGLHPIIVTSAWRGPVGGLRDFVFDHCEVEVKATLGVNRTLRISHFSQLDEADTANLFLCHIVLFLNEKGLTLSDMVNCLRSELSIDGMVMQEFERLILMAGYSDHHARHYELRRYNISALNFYTVAGSFPRIRESDILPGILDGSYSLDVQACDPYKIGIDSVLPLLGIT